MKGGEEFRMIDGRRFVYNRGTGQGTDRKGGRFAPNEAREYQRNLGGRGVQNNGRKDMCIE
jgi:hypothetical protein